MKQIFSQIAVVALFYYAFVITAYYCGSLTDIQFEAMIISGFLAVLNSVSSVWGFNKGRNSGNSKFLLYNLGLMSLRMLIILIIIFILFRYLNIDKSAFVFSFFFCYFIFLVIEIKHFAKKTIGNKI